jgi:peptidyl-prolyl cis-trans isomerase SurA|tara:strand:- start:1213 stop:2895 length:1683 start_codon:yes stop_codon:yes gene_type:complete
MEFNNYYRQLLKPYLTDKEIDKKIIAEAHERLKSDVRVSHLMLDLPKDPSPSDTLKIFNKITDLKNRIIQGENFEELARSISSDTYSARNGGDLGYFTAFNMVYPFENAAYNAQLGELVGPVRTNYGYHILKVTDKRKSRYKMSAAHILILDSEEIPKEDAQIRINEIYDRLVSGESFKMLARKYSEDKSSISRGGEFPAFGLNQMLPEFEDAVYGLSKDGDFSKPFKSELGWHIVKRIKKYEVPELEKMEAEITGKIRRDERSSISRKSFILRLRERYQLEIFNASFEAIIKGLKKGKKLSRYKKPVFSYQGLSDKKYVTQQDFAKAFQNQATRSPEISEYSVLESIIENTLMKEAELRLPNENKEFKYLAQEYREGILVFDLTREKVWDAASKDSTKIKDFFQKNLSNYQWKERRTGAVYNTSSSRVFKRAEGLLKKGVPAEKVLRLLNTKDPLALSINEFSDLEIGNKPSSLNEERFLSIVDSDLKSGLATISEEIGYSIIQVSEVKPPGPKNLSDCRGQVIADLQDSLEADWDDDLMREYPLIMNSSEWNRIKSEL